MAPTAYYAAVYDAEGGALRLIRRTGSDLDELASGQVTGAAAPLTLILEAHGASPTELRAELLDANGAGVSVVARDSRRGLQRAGEPGVLATAETLFPSDPNPVLPALGNLHLLPWAVQEGQAFMATPAGQAAVDEIRRRSTAVCEEIVVRARRGPRPTAPSVVAATTGRPVATGAELHISTDLPVRGSIELSYSPRFRRSWFVPAGASGAFEDITKTGRGLRPGRRVYWRAHLQRTAGRPARGPVRSFRVPPTRASARPFRVAVAACGAQFGPLFAHLAARRPDVFVWQGDLNYPDTHGPLAQTVSGYAGIWRDFLANPVLAAVFESAAFASQRDDHDYGVQDANATNIERYPWALEPWDALMNSRAYYRFPAGAAEVWVLDQRRFKTDPTQPDTPDKTLLGTRQRRWLLDTLARSRAPFKIVCSPCTVFMGANARDGNWGEGFTAERDLIVEHIRERVRGVTIFLTGDTHLTGVFDADGMFEARAAPVGIPKPNDITLVDPLAADKLRSRPGVAYASDENHLTLLELRGGSAPTLELVLLRDDGEEPYRRSFTPSRADGTRAR